MEKMFSAYQDGPVAIIGWNGKYMDKYSYEANVASSNLDTFFYFFFVLFLLVLFWIGYNSKIEFDCY